MRRHKRGVLIRKKSGKKRGSPSTTFSKERKTQKFMQDMLETQTEKEERWGGTRKVKIEREKSSPNKS